MTEFQGRAGKSRDSTAQKHPPVESSSEGLKKRSSDDRSDNEVEKPPSVASRDEVSSYGRSDSNADRDKSDASGIKELSKSFKELKIQENEKQQGTAYGSKTPEPKRDKSAAPRKQAKQKLIFNAPQSVSRGDSNAETDQSDEGSSSFGSSDGNAETDQGDASENKDLNDQTWDLPISKPKKQATAQGNKTPSNDGQWLRDHPWKSEKPNPTEQTSEDVYMSKVYTVLDEWLKSTEILDLEKIYLNLPKFIDKMKGSSIRKELEDVLNIDASSLKLDANSTLLKAIANTKRSPHVLEIAQKQNKDSPQDNPSFRTPDEKDNLKAFSLPRLKDPYQPSENNYWKLDCEYMLKMHLPEYSLQWFNNGDQRGRRIRKIIPGKEDKRWIFIPSFRRAEIALLDWPRDEKVTEESTIRILVVRPSEFEEYVKYCGHLFPVISLPQDEIGAGYPRYWIQKIALRLKLQFIWMIDDSVECFYEYHPGQKPDQGSYSKHRRRKFGLVFERIESLVKDNLSIVAMSPRRFNPKVKPKKQFECKPPRIAVFLNITALKSNEVYYRPELQVFEDMIFGYECEKNGLKVFLDNRILLQDHRWEHTGARSPSVQQKMT